MEYGVELIEKYFGNLTDCQREQFAALGTASGTSETDALGDATAKTQRLSAAGARTKAASSAMPK